MQFVGDEACASCHGDLYASYHLTGMGRAVSRFDSATAPEQFDAAGRSPLVCHEPSGYCYQAIRRGDSLFQQETRLDTPGYVRTHAVGYVVGSGNATRSYLMAEEGAHRESDGAYLTEMPLTWYVERALWDLSPGYGQVNDRFSRPIVLECMTCHNGQPGFAGDAVNFYTDVPLGITCERCHGSGEAHVEARLAAEKVDGPDPTIVNPARLSAGLQLAVCEQCHLTGLTVFAQGEDPTTYRPGEALAAHRAVYVNSDQVDDPERFGIASHALRLMRSACFTETRGLEQALTCTTCHDPHRPTASMGVDHFNTVCQSCHGGEGRVSAHEALCSRPDAETPIEAMTGNCVDCHMQRSGTDDIPHVTFTDHWIRRTLPEAKAPEAIARGGIRAEPFQLVDVTAREQALVGEAEPVESEASRAMNLALAYWMLYQTEHRLPDYLPRIVGGLREGLSGDNDRPEAYLALGGALADLDSLAAAEEALATGTSRWPKHAALHLALGKMRLQRGDASGARRVLDRAVELQPALIEAHLARASALSLGGQVEESIQAYREALGRNPSHFPEAWNNLGLLLLQHGQADRAIDPLQRAVQLTPTSVETRVNLGAAFLATGKLDEAATQLAAALRYNSDYAPALGNLGVVRVRQGQPEEARRLFQRVLTLQPNDAQAAAYLQQLAE